MANLSAIDKLLDLFQSAFQDGTLVKLTLSARRGADKALKNVQIRAIHLRDELQLSFVYHHATRDVTRNFPFEDGFQLLREILGTEFRNAHLFTTRCSAQLEIRDGHGARLIEGRPQHEAPPPLEHDRPKQRPVTAERPWLQDLGVTTPDGKVAKGMEGKFRQINKFIEILGPLCAEAGLESAPKVSLVDMGCGKGYLTFAAYDWLRRASERQAQVQVQVRGVEARAELVERCNAVARKHRFEGLSFEAGTIQTTPLSGLDILIALHACDTATDDAIARGIEAGARLILVSPCCHKEVRPQIQPPAAMTVALRHGILLERQAELVTDGLRAALLDWAGYQTKVFEFISTEHTAKNLMISAVRRRESKTDPVGESAEAVRRLAAEYGVGHQQLASRLGFALVSAASNTPPARGLK